MPRRPTRRQLREPRDDARSSVPGARDTVQGRRAISDNPTAEEDLFRVVFLNEFEEGANVDEIRKKVAGRFKLSEKAAAHMFGGRPVVVKTDVDVATAFQFKIVLDEIGALCQVEMMPEIDDTDGHGYVERRAEEQRKQMDRRGRMRNEHIVPDRRYTERRENSPPEDDG